MPLEIFNFSSMSNDNIVMPENPAMEFSFECDQFQKQSFQEIEKGNHVLVSVPTSSGKTLVGEYAIAYHKNRGNKIIYTSPIKSLSNEKYKEFKDKNIIDVGLLTGDNKINVDAQCIIMTAEILRNSLYKEKSEINSINCIGCVIMDEVHFINDPDRGKIWEETIIMLPDTVQLIMLSATIDRVEQFASWIASIKQKNVSLITSNKRIVPLNHYIFVDNELHLLMDNNDKFYQDNYFEAKREYDKIQKERQKAHKSEIDKTLIEKTVKFLKHKDLFQTIFFSFSRANCEKYATSLSVQIVEPEQGAAAVSVFDYNMRNYKKDYEFVPQYIKIRELIQKGIAYHHSGLIPIIKEIIEILFRDGLIKILFATETFAVGVNMPTRTVVFTELSKPNNQTKRFLNTAEYKQMSGRAGRRGKDKFGTIILLPFYDYPELSDLKNVMLSSMPAINSKFEIDYLYCLKQLDYNKNIYDKSLLNSEQKLFVKSIFNDLEMINNEIQLTNQHINKTFSEFSEADIKNFERQLYLENIGKDDSYGFAISLSKSQQKELKTLKTKNNVEAYKLYQKIKILKDKKIELENKISNTDLYATYIMESANSILLEKSYIKSSTDIDIFGRCALQCNECNSILLIEMLKNGLFDNAELEEIVALLSIFVQFKKDLDTNYRSIFNQKFNQIKSIVNEWENLEKKYNYTSRKDFWLIDESYIDITYNWAKGESMGNIIAELNSMSEYEGNFVKNMLKIYNIAVNFKKQCMILDRIDIIVKMEDLDKKILRDIVNVNSLYLQ
jgi:superfamily II RNA helicase